MQVTIDRFEGNYAVCEKENLQMINIKVTELPKGAKEGDVLNIVENIITIDKKETKKRKAEIEELTKDLWQ